MMNSMKKILCLLLSLVMLLCQLPALSLAEEMDQDADADVEAMLEEEGGDEEEEEIVYPEELIVSHPTITKGDFFTEMFGNDTADIDVRALIHGYNLVNWDQNQGVYVFDPTVVVGDPLVVEDEIGNRTYYIALAEDLFYSDGTPITAWDYAFSLLLMMAPEIEQIGGKIYRAQHILGYDEYITKQASYLSGVEVISDHQLAITLDHEFLPYFFETGLLLCVPYPIYVIAPGCKVYDDGYGIYIGNEDQSIEEPLFTAELLAKTILDPETGYNSHPSVVSGPYEMLSYDGVTSHYQINPYFKGAWFHNTLPGGDADAYYIPLLDADGNQLKGTYVHDGETIEELYYMVKPQIEKIAFTVADNDTIIEEIAAGEKHLVNKVVYGPTILKGMTGMTAMPTAGDFDDYDEPEDVEETEAEEEEVSLEMPEMLDVSGVRYQNYPRIGLAFLTFTYDWPTVHDKEVRQAIAWCMDRDQLAEDYCQGFQVMVDGYYGMEQWEYLLVTHQIDYPVNFLEDDLHNGDTAIAVASKEEQKEAIEDEEDLTKKFKNRYVRTDEEYEAAIAAWETLSLDNLVHYNVYDLELDPGRTEKVGIDKANALLDSAKWTLNRNGEPYDPEVDDVRCKMIDDELVALDLTMMYPEGNHIVDTMQENFIDNLNEVGIKLTLVPTPMQDLLYSYYRETERTTDMIYLATNFHVIVDPAITYSTDDTLNHEIWNNTYSDDEDLFYRAVNMRKTEPGDVYDYVSKWVSFQERYNEVLPTIPIYSNIYFDFYTSQLQNYWITGQVTWSQAILLAYFGEEGAEDEFGDDDFGEDFDDEDVMEFD